MSAPDQSGDGNLVRFMIEHKMVGKILAKHKPDKAGRCPVCRSLGCTLYSAALRAQKLGGSKREQ